MNKKKLKSGKSENQIRNSRISENTENTEHTENTKNANESIATPKITPTFPEIQQEVLYTIDDLIDVWSRGMTNGATLWQYCQDKGFKLPSAFEAGTIELVNEVRSSKEKAQALQALLNNNMLLLGVFDEKH